MSDAGFGDQHPPVAQPQGVSFYLSTGYEKNSRGVNVSAKSSVWYVPRAGEDTDAEIARMRSFKQIADLVAHASAVTIEQLALDSDLPGDVVPTVNRIAQEIAARLAAESEDQG